MEEEVVINPQLRFGPNINIDFPNRAAAGEAILQVNPDGSLTNLPSSIPVNCAKSDWVNDTWKAYLVETKEVDRPRVGRTTVNEIQSIDYGAEIADNLNPSGELFSADYEINAYFAYQATKEFRLPYKVQAEAQASTSRDDLLDSTLIYTSSTGLEIYLDSISGESEPIDSSFGGVLNNQVSRTLVVGSLALPPSGVDVLERDLISTPDREAAVRLVRFSSFARITNRVAGGDIAVTPNVSIAIRLGDSS